MKKMRLIAKGKVQGVGFRQSTKKLADQLGVKGTVKNEDDGSVSIEAIGTEEQMEQFVEGIRRSPTPLGKVTSLETDTDSSLQETDRFEIVY